MLLGQKLKPRSRTCKVPGVPHLVLEISENVLERPGEGFFRGLHDLALQHAPFDLKDLKSRVIVHQNYYIGDGSQSNAFIHLGIAMLAGRETEIRQNLSAAMLTYLRTAFAESLATLRCRLTVEVREIEPSTHSKLA